MAQSDTIRVKYTLAHARYPKVKAETVVEVELDRDGWNGLTTEECERAVLEWAFNEGLELDWQELD